MKMKTSSMRKGMIILVALVLAISAVYADIGPKATMDILVLQNSQQISEDFEARIIGCHGGIEIGEKEADSRFDIYQLDNARVCFWRPEELVWGGKCAGSRCSFSYMFPDLFRLAVYLPSLNKTILSEPIERKNFHSTYEADINQSGMQIKETTSFSQSDFGKQIGLFAVNLSFTLLAEIIAALAILKMRKKQWQYKKGKIILTVLAANLISVPIVFFVFPLMLSTLYMTVLSEIFAVLFEGAFIYILNKKLLTIKESFIMSIIMNAISFLIGIPVYMVYMILSV